LLDACIYAVFPFFMVYLLFDIDFFDTHISANAWLCESFWSLDLCLCCRVLIFYTASLYVTISVLLNFYQCNWLHRFHIPFLSIEVVFMFQKHLYHIYFVFRVLRTLRYIYC
jgi:hypothetical protein